MFLRLLRVLLLAIFVFGLGSTLTSPPNVLANSGDPDEVIERGPGDEDKDRDDGKGEEGEIGDPDEVIETPQSATSGGSAPAGAMRTMQWLLSAIGRVLSVLP